MHAHSVGAILFLFAKEGRGLPVTSPADLQGLQLVDGSLVFMMVSSRAEVRGGWWTSWWRDPDPSADPEPSPHQPRASSASSFRCRS